MHVTALKFFREAVQVIKYENCYSLQKTWKEVLETPTGVTNSHNGVINYQLTI